MKEPNLIVAPRSRLHARLFALLALCSLLHAPCCNAQGVLNDTDYGKSQNTGRDLVNSLVPAKPSLTKGEKKAEVDPKTLQSKKIKDPAFEGGLNDLGLDWNGDKMGKPHGSQGANSTAGGRELSANRSREAGDSVSGEPSMSNSGADSKTTGKKEQGATDERSTSEKSHGDTGGEKESKASKPSDSSGADQPKAAKAAAAAAADEKSQKSSDKEKVSAGKPDGDH